MTRLDNGTWIVVADAEKALLMENVTDHADPNFRIIRREDNAEAHVAFSDRPGRRPDPGPSQMSAVEEDDWHDLSRDRFARDLAELLYARAHKGDFSRLVIAAAPDVLGTLRKELHPEVANRIVAEIPKTLTNHPVRSLERLIKAELDNA
ncbi:MAG: host attachment family protein [Marinibacterium sp.]